MHFGSKRFLTEQDRGEGGRRSLEALMAGEKGGRRRTDGRKGRRLGRHLKTPPPPLTQITPSHARTHTPPLHVPQVSHQEKKVCLLRGKTCSSDLAADGRMTRLTAAAPLHEPEPCRRIMRMR
ncbi:hypothetical protein FQA47_024533 [Oryzias melastigma]|uniref:Uncharacterized protein n=1 Tax=Oryzias melastigma TaxID=30732 RepID=A0A834FJW0_ORYME|nr:hypothetical protein FQA47_024533 [Oryzias melastigma]